MREAAWREPSAVGVGATVLFHLLLGVALFMIRVTVRPMAAPPLEVELLAGDVHGAAQTPVPQAPAMPPRLQEHRGDVAPLRHPTPDEPVVPDLPTSPFLDRVPTPSLRPPEVAGAGPSPGARLAPVPVVPSRTTGSGVKVRVEGTLSSRRLVHLVDPAFPPDAPSGGVVKVRLVAAADGTVKSATLVYKAHPSLEEAALDALRQWRFAPVPGAADAEGVVTVEFVLR